MYVLQDSLSWAKNRIRIILHFIKSVFTLAAVLMQSFFSSYLHLDLLVKGVPPLCPKIVGIGSSISQPTITMDGWKCRQSYTSGFIYITDL